MKITQDEVRFIKAMRAKKAEFQEFVDNEGTDDEFWYISDSPNSDTYAYPNGGRGWTVETIGGEAVIVDNADIARSVLRYIKDNGHMPSNDLLY